jgi:hypothetical protein
MVRLRMLQILGDEAAVKKCERELADYSPEVVAREEDIVQRWEQAHPPTKEEREDRARQAEEVRQRLRKMAEELHREAERREAREGRPDHA